jgi:hypothetical protein
MKTVKTYMYRQAGQQEGPFFKSQIIGMATSGIIRADAIVQCVQDNAERPLSEFLVPREVDLTDAMVVVDVKIPFDSVLKLALQWTLALLLVGAVLGVAYLILLKFFA